MGTLGCELWKSPTCGYSDVQHRLATVLDLMWSANKQFRQLCVRTRVRPVRGSRWSTAPHGAGADPGLCVRTGARPADFWARPLHTDWHASTQVHATCTSSLNVRCGTTLMSPPVELGIAETFALFVRGLG